MNWAEMALLRGTRALFPLPNEAENWDMAPDGSRFLVAMRVGEYTPRPFTVLLNWQSALSR